MDHSNRSGLRPVPGTTDHGRSRMAGLILGQGRLFSSLPGEPSADFCRAVRSPLSSLSRVVATQQQTSWGNSSRLPRAIAGSTLPVLDEYGLCSARLARPTLVPHIRFLFIDSRFCSTLLSDPASRPKPLRFANPSPPSGWVEDFHFLAAGHAQHTVPCWHSCQHCVTAKTERRDESRRGSQERPRRMLPVPE